MWVEEEEGSILKMGILISVPYDMEKKACSSTYSQLYVCLEISM